MTRFTVTVYTGQFQERIEIDAVNQAHLKERVRGLGYDRLTAIHNSRQV